MTKRSVDRDEEYIRLGLHSQLPQESSRYRGKTNEIRERVRRVITTNRELAEQIIAQSGLNYKIQRTLRDEFGFERRKPGRQRTQKSIDAEEQIFMGSTPRDASIEKRISYSHSRRLARHLEREGYQVNRTPRKRQTKAQRLREEMLKGKTQAEARKIVKASRTLAHTVANQLRNEGYPVTQGQNSPVRRKV